MICRNLYLNKLIMQKWGLFVNCTYCYFATLGMQATEMGFLEINASAERENATEFFE